jgi:hypothetical protein
MLTGSKFQFFNSYIDLPTRNFPSVMNMAMEQPSSFVDRAVPIIFLLGFRFAPVRKVMQKDVLATDLQLQINVHGRESGI